MFEYLAFALWTTGYEDAANNATQDQCLNDINIVLKEVDADTLKIIKNAMKSS